MSDKTSDKRLLNCPFCGGEAELVGDKYHWVLCKDCKGGSHAFENVEEAIEKWNTRKPMQEILERLEEERNLLKHERNEAIEYDDEQIIFATNNQIRAFDYSIRVVKEVGGKNGKSRD